MQDPMTLLPFLASFHWLKDTGPTSLVIYPLLMHGTKSEQKGLL
jgi:hypothetical protein